jgi:hypothetical protein
MFGKMLQRLNDRLARSIANDVLSYYCSLFQRILDSVNDPEVGHGDIKEAVSVAGIFIGSQAFNRMPPKSIWQHAMLQNVESVFSDSAGISDKEVLIAISHHVRYISSTGYDAVDQELRCRDNLVLSKCENYSRFWRLRDDVRKVING